MSYTHPSSAFNSVQSFSRPIEARKFFVFSSEGNIEHVAPNSAPMFVIVARCGTVRDFTPSPKYSYIARVPPFTVSFFKTSRIMSFALTPFFNFPVSFTPNILGIAR